MRLILKILATTLVAVLAIISWLFAFLLNLSSVVFGIAGTLVGVLGLAVLITGPVKNGIILLVMAFLVGPLGIPMAMAWLLGQVQQLRCAIQDWIYG